MRLDPILDAPLLNLSHNDEFTVRDAVQGVCITGGIGSGKTSGSGQALALAYLRAGMGGLVLAAKADEAPLWRSYCARAKRSDQLIELNGQQPIINFLNYELARQGASGLGSVVELMMRVLEMARASSPTPGQASDHFWTDTSRQVFRNSIPAIYAATGTVRIADILRFVRSAPTSPEEMRDLEWQRRSFFFEIFMRAAEHLDEATGERITAYWQSDFGGLDPKTRGNILISLTTALDRLNHGWLHTAFCTETRVVPELTFHGAIILLNMPALTLNEDGVFAQQLFKFLWQRAVLARNSLPPEQQVRPIFLFSDESQYFLNSYDAEFLSTCRGSRACTVFLSQSLPTFYATMGGDHPRERVQHLLGNFATKIWHSNSCPETNRWAADTLGQVVKRRSNFSEGEGFSRNSGMNMGEGENSGTTWSGSNSYNAPFNGRGGSSGGSYNSGSSHGQNDSWGQNRGEGTSTNTSFGYSEQMGYLIEPGQFGRMLKTGGPANGNRVSAVWYQAGRRFLESSGNSLLAEFQQ